jgi:hypothetical protein
VLNTLYNKYRVDRARYTVRFVDTTNDGLLVGLQLRGANCAGSSGATLCQRPGNETRNMSNTGEQTVVFQCATDCAKAFGQTKAIYHANYGAVVSSNPGGSSPDFTLVLHAWMISIVSAVSTCTVIVEIDYDCDFFDVQV